MTNFLLIFFLSATLVANCIKAAVQMDNVQEPVYCNRDGCTGPCKDFEKSFVNGYWRDYSFAIYECQTIKFLAVIGFDFRQNYKSLNEALQKYDELYARKFYEYKEAIPDPHDETDPKVLDYDELVVQDTIIKDTKLKNVDVKYALATSKIQELIRKCPETTLNINWRKQNDIGECSGYLDSITKDVKDLVDQIKLLSSTLNAKLLKDMTETHESEFVSVASPSSRSDLSSDSFVTAKTSE